jgi:hypothetical protein
MGKLIYLKDSNLFQTWWVDFNSILKKYKLPGQVSMTMATKLKTLNSDTLEPDL